MKQLDLFRIEKSTSDVSYLLEDECTDSESELKYYDYVLSESKCTTRNDSESKTIPQLSESSSGTIQIYQSKGTSRGNNFYYVSFQLKQFEPIQHLPRDTVILVFPD